MTSKHRTARVAGALMIASLTVGTFASTAGADVPGGGVRTTVDLGGDHTLRGYCESLRADIDDASDFYVRSTPREQKFLVGGLRSLVTDWNRYCAPVFSLVIVPPASWA